MTPRIIVANLGVRLKSFYRERSAMFFTFAFPVILVLVFGTIFTKPEHLNFDRVSGIHDLTRMLDSFGPTHLGNVHQTLDTRLQLYKGAIVGHACHLSV